MRTRNERICVWLREWEKKAIEQAAEARGVNVSTFVRGVAFEEIRHGDPEPMPPRASWQDRRGMTERGQQD